MSLLFAFRSNYFSRRVVAIAFAWIAALASGMITCRAGDQGAEPPRTPEAVYGEGVRPTNKLSPAEEQAGFHLPAGFVAELVAAEPQISKPLNMAFDKLGRLWVTDTLEYPYPAAPGAPARDSIKVLADRDGNGSFETVTTFADGLNIPIGILPVDDGVICFSIPNIMHLRDVDGDGRCDERKVLLGPFDTSRDTHGMINALRLGPDGWVYACHGFNNQSHVEAADGSEIHLISGNTFRFRADGSHVEQFTSGQVNPFGMTSDEWGNWFTADCHSKPVTLLIRGGCYESFGRPHDGLGFVPPLMNHLHGSTAICGINYYMADQFPAEFRHKFYSGNVMTSRINCNRLQVDRDHIT
ncbi:MAG: PVC-type heme-binding CxxCH protein, partial [Aureliella sp.]